MPPFLLISSNLILAPLIDPTPQIATGPERSVWEPITISDGETPLVFCRDSPSFLFSPFFEQPVTRKKIKVKNVLPDNELIALLKKMVKQRNDSCEAYKKAGRKDLLENELSEISIINEFLPKQLGDEETKKLCIEKIKQLGASSIKDMGKVIGALKK